MVCGNMLPMALAQASMVICVLLPDDGPYTFLNPFGATLLSCLLSNGIPLSSMLYIDTLLSMKLFLYLIFHNSKLKFSV